MKLCNTSRSAFKHVQSPGTSVPHLIQPFCGGTAQHRQQVPVSASTVESAQTASSRVWGPTLATLVTSSLAFAAHAEEAVLAAGPAAVADAVSAAADAPEAAAVLEAAAPLSTPGELAVVAAPIVLYGIFTGYRSFLNPKATFNDFLFLAVALGIVYNIVSILVFKVRIL